MRGLRVSPRLSTKRSNAGVLVHSIFSAQHFHATTSSVKFSQQWGWSIATSLGQDLAPWQARFGSVKGGIILFLLTTHLNGCIQGMY